MRRLPTRRYSHAEITSQPKSQRLDRRNHAGDDCDPGGHHVAHLAHTGHYDDPGPKPDALRLYVEPFSFSYSYRRDRLVVFAQRGNRSPQAEFLANDWD